MHEELKQFIVCGASAGGKTAFSYELLKRYHVQHIQIDPILEAFEDVFPELGITHDANTHEKHNEVCQNFKPFLFRMIDGMRVNHFVIEGFRMPLVDLHAQYGATHGIYVFGYPNITPKEKVALCRKHDLGNWTSFMDDEELAATFEFLIAESGYLQEKCATLNIPFFDTGQDYYGEINRALRMVAVRYC
jgi:hypothetical protein